MDDAKRMNLVGAVMIYIYSSEIGKVGKVVLVKDKRFDDARWKLPGGSIEPNDRNIIAAAIREAKEETGGGILGIQLLPSEVLIISTDKRTDTGYRPFLCMACVSDERLSRLPKIGNENGHSIMIGLFDRSEVEGMMVDFLDEHRPLVLLAEKCIRVSWY